MEKPTHQAHFWPVFVPGGAQNPPTRRTFAGFSYLVFVAGGYFVGQVSMGCCYCVQLTKYKNICTIWKYVPYLYRNSTYPYIVMLVVSSKEFRDNQKNYLDKIDEGIEILLHRGKNKAYRIIPVTEDDTLMSKEAFFAKIDKSLAEAREGNLETFDTVESLMNFLEKL